MKEVLKGVQAAGGRVVFTNGCFDIIHAGHLRTLQAASGMGDILVVAVNSDGSVARLKPGRPIIGQGYRAEVIAGFESVDYVIIFGEDTPERIINELRPDVLVKGGDYGRAEIVGADVVPDVRTVPYIEGLSTSGIIEKIMRLK